MQTSDQPAAAPAVTSPTAAVSTAASSADAATTLPLAELEAALGPVRELLQADGADIAVSQVVGTQVELQLLLEGSSCPECVLPAPALEPIALEMLSAGVPGLSAVSIADPRSGADSGTGSGADSGADSGTEAQA